MYKRIKFRELVDTKSINIVRALLSDKSSKKLFSFDHVKDARINNEQLQDYLLYKSAFNNNEFRNQLFYGKVSDHYFSIYIVPIFKAFAKITDPSAVRIGNPYVYLAWICDAYLQAQEPRKHNPDADPDIWAENLYVVRFNLEDFEAFRKNFVKPEQRDIGYFTDIFDLRSFLVPFQLKRDGRKKKKAKETENIRKNTTILYDGPEGRILIPHSEEAGIFWGLQTKWCISAKRTKNWFNNYNENSEIYIFIPVLTELEKKMRLDYYSYKHASYNGTFYDEYDYKEYYLMPWVKRLIQAATQKMTIIDATKFIIKLGLPRLIDVVPGNEEDWDNPSVMIPLLRDHAWLAKFTWENKDIFIEAIKYDPDLLKISAHKIIDDLDIAKLVLKESPYHYRYLSDGIRARKDLALQAVTKCASNIEYVSQCLKSDKDIALRAVGKNPLMLQYIKPALRDDWDIALAAVNSRKVAMGFISKRLRDDEDFIYAAIQKSASAMLFASDRIRDNSDFAKEMINRFGNEVLKYVSVRLRSSSELV